MSLDPKVKHVSLMNHIRPVMRKRPEEPWAVWQAKARPQLEKLLGLPLESCDPAMEIEWQEEVDGKFTEIRFNFHSEPGVKVVCHLWLPKTEEKKVPLVICMQGHATGMHVSMGRPKFPGDEEDINDGDRDFARQIIARGQAALSLEQRAFGERGGTPKGPDCRHAALQAIMLGRTLIGERVWDVSRTIDVVEKHFPMIDMDRIAVMGNSGGGTTTIYAAALDQRIAAAMPSCALCGFLPSIGAQQHCECNYIPNIMKYFDMGDIVGLVAPRALVAINGKLDPSFPVDSAVEQVEIARPHYRELGAEDKLRHIIAPEGHRFYAALGWPVFDEVTGWKE